MILLSCTADWLHCQSEDSSLWWTQIIICTKNWHLYTQIRVSAWSRQVDISGGVSLQYLRISMSFSANWPNKWKLFYFYLYLIRSVFTVMSWKSGKNLCSSDSCNFERRLNVTYTSLLLLEESSCLRPNTKHNYLCMQRTKTFARKGSRFLQLTLGPKHPHCEAPIESVKIILILIFIPQL